jgi:hypothetical protein
MTRSTGGLAYLYAVAEKIFCCFPLSGSDLLPITSNAMMNAVIYSGLQRPFVRLLVVVIIDYTHIYTIWCGMRTQHISVTRIHSFANTMGVLSGRCA